MRKYLSVITDQTFESLYSQICYINLSPYITEKTVRLCQNDKIINEITGKNYFYQYCTLCGKMQSIFML
jgi:hypothetical protein